VDKGLSDREDSGKAKLMNGATKSLHQVDPGSTIPGEAAV
jgi:hypothetical protein